MQVSHVFMIFGALWLMRKIYEMAQTRTEDNRYDHPLTMVDVGAGTKAVPAYEANGPYAVKN